MSARWTAFVALLLAGCASSGPPPKPPGLPPTPKTVTLKNPGGDAADPEQAALKRLLEEPWGFKRDRWKTMRVPLADWKHWRRVRLWGHPMRASYRYGDEAYAVETVWYQPAEGPDDPDACMARFLAYARPITESFDVRLGPATPSRTTQQVGGESRPMLVHTFDGSIESLLGGDEYVAALAAYQSWPGTCLVYAFAVRADNHRDLAVQVRDRWVSDGAKRLLWEKKVTEAPPFDAR
ncbi:MAG: hypothetical protein WKG00_08885 [Polyangiaceae bacterium]